MLGEVLEHVEDDLAGLREVARVVRPGGIVAISVPANPAWFGPSDEWAGHFRRYTRAALLELMRGRRARRRAPAPVGLPGVELLPPADLRAAALAQGPAAPTRAQRPAVAALGAALQVDRLFVGVERGALGYLLLARFAAASRGG